MRGDRAARAVKGAMLASFLVAVGVTVSACANRAGDCKANGECGGSHPAVTSSGGGADTSSSSSSLMNPACAGDPGEMNGDETCAVFVRKNAAGKGTRKDPYGDLALAAEAAAGRKRIYACGDFDVTFTPGAPFELWGGFDCDTWTWSASKRSKLEVPADHAAVIADVTGQASIHTFAIHVLSGTKNGSSSVGVVFGASADAEIDRSEIAVELGQDNVTDLSNPPMIGDASVAPDPSGGTSSCTDSTGVPGAKVVCRDGKTLIGGSGGDGALGMGSSGGVGTVEGKKIGGAAGQGDTGSGCTNGAPGADGIAGEAGAGGEANQTRVTFVKSGDKLTGEVAIDDGAGARGKFGSPGRPGGGGGAYRGRTTPSNCVGSPGGGASSGGCGGDGGSPGGEAGSSIGVACLGSSLVIHGVSITTKIGGNGGNGIDGVAGGAKVLDATPLTGLAGGNGNGCNGGNGGGGGKGGPGGGGRGGHSIDVAFFKTPTKATYIKDSTKNWHHAEGGRAGTSIAGGNDGEKGIGATCWDFDSRAACP